MRRLVVTMSIAGAAALVVAPAFADATKAQCVDANTSAQSLRRGGKFSAAREQLQVCGDPKCPDLVRRDCIERLDELERAQPTIVFDVHDDTGTDITNVRISLDGTLFAEKLDGGALRVDPGTHSFTFQVADQNVVTESLLIKEGEKGRRQRIVIAAAHPAQSSAPPPIPARPQEQPPEEPRSDRRPLRTLGLISGGAGLAGVAVGTVFGLLASSSFNQQQEACASPTDCADHARATSEHESAVTQGAISTISFVAGGALLAAGVALFVIGAKGSSTPASTARATRFGDAGLRVSF